MGKTVPLWPRPPAFAQERRMLRLAPGCNLSDDISEFSWRGDSTAAHVINSGLVVSVGAGYQFVPVIGAEKGPEGDRGTAGALALCFADAFPGERRPANLLLNVSSEMDFS